MRQGKSIVLATLSNRVKDKLYQPWGGTQEGQSACVLRRKKPESGNGRRGWTMVGSHPSGCRFLGLAPQGVAPCMPGTVLGAGDTALSKGDKVKKVCRLVYRARQC